MLDGTLPSAKLRRTSKPAIFYVTAVPVALRVEVLYRFASPQANALCAIFHGAGRIGHILKYIVFMCDNRIFETGLGNGID